MPIYTSDGEAYESDFHLEAGEPMPKEEPPNTDLSQQNKPLQITVTKERPPVTLSDVGRSALNDVYKFAHDVWTTATIGPKLMEKAYKGELDPDSDATIKALTDTTLTYGLGSLVTAPLREGVGMFGGALGTAKAAERPTFYSLGKQDIIKEAQKDLDRGIDPQKVFDETGVFRGPEGKLRYEFSDDTARLKTENLELNGTSTSWTKDPVTGKYPEVPTYKTPYFKEGKIDWEKTKELRDRGGSRAFYARAPGIGPKTVGDLIDHPTLFKHYPDIAKMELESGPWFNFNVLGWHDPKKNKLFIKGNTEKEMLSVLLHEIQHAIQSREGFAKGGNPGMFKSDPAMYEKVSKQAQELDANLKAQFEAIAPELQQFEKEWNKTHWRSGPLEYGDIKGMFSKYQEGSDFSDVQKKVVEHLYDKHKEFFSDVGTLTEAQRLIGNIDNRASQKYRQLYGEFEARATQERRQMDKFQREQTPVWEGHEYNQTYPEGLLPEGSIRTE